LKAGAELDKLNCVHRDVKLDNFLFIPQDFSVKICDFGEAINFGNINTITKDKFETM